MSFSAEAQDNCYYYYKDKKIKILSDSTSTGILTKDTNAVIQILKTKNIKYLSPFRPVRQESGLYCYYCKTTDLDALQWKELHMGLDIYGSPAVLTAEDINEPADYRWYDNQGVEVGSGTSCYVNPQQTTTYTLRVTAEEDGYRSYDQVTVNVAMMRICSVSPNPAEGQARVSYELSRSVSAATLQILNGSGQVVYSQALSGGNGSKVTGELLVNTSSLAAGSYTVRLVSSTGKVHDSRTLVVR